MQEKTETVQDLFFSCYISMSCNFWRCTVIPSCLYAERFSSFETEGRKLSMQTFAKVEEQTLCMK